MTIKITPGMYVMMMKPSYVALAKKIRVRGMKMMRLMAER